MENGTEKGSRTAGGCPDKFQFEQQPVASACRVAYNKIRRILTMDQRPKNSTARTPGTTLILGIGNLLMGDEGVGVHAIRLLQTESSPPSVDKLDGGTGGFQLLSLFQDYKRIILIDATMDGSPPGTIRIIRPRFASDFPRTLSAHDIGLRDMIESASLLGALPSIDLITVAIPEIQPMTLELSPIIQQTLPKIVESVHKLLGVSA